MASLTRFIERRLKLQITAEKSAVARPCQRSFLGFTVRDDLLSRAVAHDQANPIERDAEADHDLDVFALLVSGYRRRERAS